MPQFQIFARVEKHGIFSEREQNITAKSLDAAKQIFCDGCTEEQYKISGEIGYSFEQQEPEPTKAAKAPKAPKTAKGGKKSNG